MPRPRLPARLRQRKDDKAWIIHDGEKRIRTGCGDGQREQAEAVLQKYLVSKASKIEIMSAPKDVAIGNILAFYLDNAKQGKDNTRQVYGVKALAPFWANRVVGDVKGRTCREYLKYRGVASGTVRRELGVLQAAINYAHAEGMLTHPVKVSLSEKSKPKDRYLTRDELAALIRVAPKHLQRFILISMYTGRRKRAVLDLKWERNDHAGWVDLDAGMIHFLGDSEIESSKGRGSILVLPSLLSYLRRWYNADPMADGVITYNGNQIGDVKNAFARACEMAGIEDATPHTLKHTAVTLAFQSEMTMEQATQYFATSRETLERVYRKHSPLHNRAALGPMQRLGKQ